LCSRATGAAARTLNGSEMATSQKDINVKLFTDGADKAQILDMANQPWIRVFTAKPFADEGGQSLRLSVIRP
jgi:hypothetical protein